jgi:peroxiredoxin
MRVFISLVLLSFSLTAWSQDDNRGYSVSVGEQAPEMSFKLLDGTPVNNESLKGKVVVLQFTASWCGVCRKEMPHLEKEVWQRFKSDDFLLIGIDLKEEEATVREFIQKMGTSYPIAIDHDGSIFASYTLPKAGVTRNIVLNKAGEIIFLTRLYEREEFEEMISVIEKELQQ